MSRGFTKLDSGIVDSSIWSEDDDVLRVWICLLAKSDSVGYARISKKALSQLCRIPVTRCDEIMTLLSSPDEDSRTPDHEGRRVERVDGGWLILNYESYRKRHSKGPMSGAERQRRYVDRKKLREVEGNGSVTKSDVSVTVRDENDKKAPEAEAEAEADPPPCPPVGGTSCQEGPSSQASSSGVRSGRHDDQGTLPGCPSVEDGRQLRLSEFGEEFVECWNLVCAEQDGVAGSRWVRAQKFSKWGQGRRESLGARMKEEGFMANWEEALEKAKASPFWNGNYEVPKGRKRFRANVDTFLRRDTVMNLVEGKYESGEVQEYDF